MDCLLIFYLKQFWAAKHKWDQHWIMSLLTIQLVISILWGIDCLDIIFQVVLPLSYISNGTSSSCKNVMEGRVVDLGSFSAYLSYWWKTIPIFKTKAINQTGPKLRWWCKCVERSSPRRHTPCTSKQRAIEVPEWNVVCSVEAGGDCNFSWISHFSFNNGTYLFLGINESNDIFDPIFASLQPFSLLGPWKDKETWYQKERRKIGPCFPRDTAFKCN